MSLTNYDERQFEEDPDANGQLPVPEKKPSNRTFLIAMGILGVILVLALILLLRGGSSFDRRAKHGTPGDCCRHQRREHWHRCCPLTDSTRLGDQVPPRETPVKTSTPIATATSRLSAAEMATVQALQTQMAGQAVELL